MPASIAAPDFTTLDMVLHRSTIAKSFSDRFGVNGILNTGNLTINQSIVIENIGGGGGGISNSGMLAITLSTISGTVGVPLLNADGILNTETLIASNRTISGNSGRIDAAGGILNAGTASLTNSTISGNSSDGGTSGIDNGGTESMGAALTLNSSTIANNEGGRPGRPSPGGVFNHSGAMASLSTTILAGNPSIGNAHDCMGIVTSLGYNLIETTASCTITGNSTGNVLNQDVKLGALENNGGLTRTHALLPDSPAVEAGNPAISGTSSTACSVIEERGEPRPQDWDRDGMPRCDIGAVELVAIGPRVFLPLLSNSQDQRCESTLLPASRGLMLQAPASLPFRHILCYTSTQRC